MMLTTNTQTSSPRCFAKCTLRYRYKSLLNMDTCCVGAMICYELVQELRINPAPQA